MVEIQKPRIECIENTGDDSYGKYVVEPLERGCGTTLGNSLRRTCCPRCLVPRLPPSRSPVFSTSLLPFLASRKM